MASTYTTGGKFEKPADGEQSGTWGGTLRSNYDLFDEALFGYTTQAITTADVTLTMDVTTCVARHMVIELTGTSTASRNLIVPAARNYWVIYNNTSGGYDHTVKVSGQTGVSVPNGQRMILYCDGTDVRPAQTYNSGALALTGGSMTGSLTFAAGTTALAPAKFQAGSVLTTPVAHAVEWNGTNLFVTNSSASRKTVAYTDSNITGSAATLTTSRSITATGDASWTVSFNGSANVSAALTLANSGVTAATYGSATQVPVITVDAKGRITSASNTTISGGGGGVTSFNTRTGAVTLTSSDVTTALTYTPASTASPTFTGTLTAANLTATGNVQIGDAAGDTLNFYSSSVTWNNNPTHSANHTFSGNLTVHGNTTIGNASGDSLTIHPSTVAWQAATTTHNGNHVVAGNLTVEGNTTIGNATGDTFTVTPNAVTWSNNPTHSGNHTFSGNVTVNGTLTASTFTSPGVASAGCFVTVSGTTPTKQKGFNTGNVTRTSTGVYKIALNPALSDTNYAMAVHASRAAGGIVWSETPGTRATNEISITFQNLGGSSVEPDSFSAMFYEMD